jgi:hypothetical protein
VKRIDKSSMVELLPDTLKALDSIPSTEKQTTKNKTKYRPEGLSIYSPSVTLSVMV